MRALFITAILVTAPDRPNPTPDVARPFTEQLTGEWQVVASQLAGSPHMTVKPGQALFVFAGDKMMLRRLDSEKQFTYTFTLDTAKSPATFDFGTAKTKASTKFAAGIIKIEGDLLTLCFQSGGVTARPTEFVSTAGSRIVLWQMKRAKK